MMKLLSSPLSPYVRKVTLTIAMKGLTSQVDVHPVDSGQPDNKELTSKNPLGKIPTLIADDMVLFDSKVICEYLDSLAPSPALFPASGAARFKTLAMGALADGILDAALLLVYEKRFRPEEKWHPVWMDRQQGKIDRTLAVLEKDPPVWGANPDYGHITVACALGYLDFRHEGKWRPAHPKLVAWLDRFAAAVPAFEETRPKA